MIDWIIEQRIATFVAGTGDAEPPTADLTALAAESTPRERRSDTIPSNRAAATWQSEAAIVPSARRR